MKLRLLASLALAGAMLAGCASPQQRAENTDWSHPADPHAVNPYSTGGFSDPGPNYPPTGH
jgi:uncharacterized lipoprotein YajG